MKKILIFSTIAAVLITAMSVGFTSCSKDEKEPPVSSDPIMGKWESTYNAEGKIDVTKHTDCDATHVDFITATHYIEFRKDGTFTYTSEKETINGGYTITESIEGMFNVETFDAIQPVYPFFIDCTGARFNMQVTGSSAFNLMYVYHFYSYGFLEHIVVQVGNGMFSTKSLGGFKRSTGSVF